MTADEIKTSADILRRSGHIDSDATFHGCCIHEPPKVEVASWIAGDLADRRLDLVVHSKGETYEARVSISRGEVDRWELVPGVIPRVGFVELSKVMEACKNNPDFQIIGKRCPQPGFDDRTCHCPRRARIRIRRW